MPAKKKASKRLPWKTANPKKKSTSLSPTAKAAARAAAKAAGRRYPNLVDNMHAAAKQRKEKANKTDSE